MNGRTRITLVLAGLAMVLTMAAGCSTTPTSTSDRQSLHVKVDSAIAEFKRVDPSMSKFFGSAYGYAMLPSVTKGGLGVGGAYGRGELFEKDKMIGYCDLSQGTFGLQAGGQSYMEIIFFESRLAFERFKSGNFALAAQASAVAAKKGASADADYERGVAVFTMVRGGLMAEASVGGQKFSFEAARR